MGRRGRLSGRESTYDNCLTEGVLLRAGQLAPRSKVRQQADQRLLAPGPGRLGEVTIIGHSRFASACRKIPSSTPRLLRPAHPRRRCPPWCRSRTRCSCRRLWARWARAWWRRRHRDQPDTPAGLDGLVHRALRCQGHLVADHRCPPQTGDEDPPRSTLPSKTHEHGKEAVDVGSALLR